MELQIRKMRDAKPIMKTNGTQLSVLIDGNSTSQYKLKSIGYEEFI